MSINFRKIKELEKYPPAKHYNAFKPLTRTQLINYNKFKHQPKWKKRSRSRSRQKLRERERERERQRERQRQKQRQKQRQRQRQRERQRERQRQRQRQRSRQKQRQIQRRRSSSYQEKNKKFVACKFYQRGLCKKQDNCQYSHSQSKSRYKTVICSNFPDCKFGDKCIYAHGNEQLRN